MGSMTLEARVERGARLLDKREPGWAKRIDVSSLNLDDCADCVVGQLFGDFEGGIKELFWYRSERRAVTHGFNTLADQKRDAEFDRLTTLWAGQVAKRRGMVVEGVQSRVAAILAAARLSAADSSAR